MNNYSYFTFYNVDCILIEKINEIILIPCNEEDLNLLFKHNSDKNFIIHYSMPLYKNVFSYIERVEMDYRSISLIPKYIIYSTEEKICSIQITGDAIDDFFSPSTYFYKDRDVQHDILYKSEYVDSWNIKFRNIELKLSLSYGKILNKRTASDLMLHPILEVEFPETDDYDLIYNIFLSIERFLKFILYKQNCGSFKIDLYNKNDEKNFNIGFLCINNLKAQQYEKSYKRIIYSDYKQFLPLIFQFIFNNENLYLKHLSDCGFINFEVDDMEIVYPKLFTAFENECDNDEKTYNIADDSSVTELRENILKTIEKNFKIKELKSEREKQFLNNVKQSISREGKRFGQKVKIINAYNVLSEAISDLVKKIVCSNKETDLNDTHIKKVAENLTGLRGKLVHSGYTNKLTSQQCNFIRFFEVMIYAQMLRRAALSSEDIRLIIGSTFLLSMELYQKNIEEQN